MYMLHYDPESPSANFNSDLSYENSDIPVCTRILHPPDLNKCYYYIDSGERLKFLSERKVIINCEIIFHNFTQGNDVTINVVNLLLGKRLCGLTFKT